MNPQAQPIYHLVVAGYWQLQAAEQPYLPPTFAEEGFIHCTAGSELLLKIANLFFADLTEPLLVLEIDRQRLTAPLKFEPPTPPIHPEEVESEAPFGPETLFPHIYGPLNRPAIIHTFALQRDEAGRWGLP